MLFKFIAILLLILGEVLTIYAEIAGAKACANFSSLVYTQVGLFLGLVVLGSILLLSGYCLGTIAFGSIWTISAISVASILIIEPGLSYHVFQELPNVPTLVGVILGALGLTITLAFSS